MSSWKQQSLGNQFKRNGDSNDPLNQYQVEYILPEATRVKNPYISSNLEEYFSELILLPPSPKPKKEAITKLVRLLKVNTGTAKDIFDEIGNEVDQFCKEEGIRPLSSDEKADLLTGMIQAIKGISKTMTERLE